MKEYVRTYVQSLDTTRKVREERKKGEKRNRQEELLVSNSGVLVSDGARVSSVIIG